MYQMILYAILLVLGGMVLYKAGKQKPEWMLLLMIISFVKSCIMFLLGATNVFTVFWIGDIQVHLDDIVFVCFLLFLLLQLFKIKIYVSSYSLISLLLIVPIFFSFFRGILSGNTISSVFIANVRVYISFITVFLAFFVVMDREHTRYSISKFEKYLDNTVTVVTVFIVFVWMLDVLVGIRYLPGQIAGTLSDGGSTFRIIHADQTVIIAFYVLWQMHRDLSRGKMLRLRTLVLTIVVLLLRWRTVIIAFAVGAVIIIISALTDKRSVSKNLIVQVIFLAIIGVVGNMLSNDRPLNAMIVNIVSGIITNTGTFGTRTGVWSEMLSTLNGIDVFIGHPFGTALGIEWQYYAHNAYVDYMMVTGLIGTALLVLTMIYLIIDSFLKRERLLSAVLIALAIYWMAYGFSIEQAAVLGFTAAMLHQKKIAIKKRLMRRTEKSVYPSDGDSKAEEGCSLE